MTEPMRVTPKEIYEKVKSGTTLLVCAYDDDAKFKKMQLEGAVSLSEFKMKLPSLSKDQEIIFYWHWPNEGTAAGQAAKYIAMGFKNVRCLAGGFEAWRKAGYPLVNPE